MTEGDFRLGDFIEGKMRQKHKAFSFWFIKDSEISTFIYISIQQKREENINLELLKSGKPDNCFLKKGMRESRQNQSDSKSER